MPNGKITFKLGADPEFSIVTANKKIGAKSLFRGMKENLKEDFKNLKETDDAMGYTVGKSKSEFGWDGAEDTGELRPAPSENPKILTASLKKSIEQIGRMTGPFKLTTKSIAAPIGGHIHMEIPEDIARNSRKLILLQKKISSMYLPLILSDDMISSKARMCGNSSYGSITDYRVEIREGKQVMEFRTPSAEWITTEKIAYSTLCYFKVILHEIYNNPKSFNENNLTLIRSWEQGKNLQNLAVSKNPIMTKFMMKEVVNKVKRFELYTKYKNEISFITNPKRVIAEKVANDYDIIKGWGISKAKKVGLKKFKEKVKINETESSTMQMLIDTVKPRYNSDENVEYFATEIAKRIIAKKYDNKKNAVLFGLRGEIKNQIIFKLGFTETEGGDMREEIQVNEQAQEMIDSREDLRALRDLAIRMHQKFTMNRGTKESWYIGIPHKDRINPEKSIKGFLDSIYKVNENKTKMIDLNNIVIEDRKEIKEAISKAYNRETPNIRNEQIVVNSSSIIEENEIRGTEAMINTDTSLNYSNTTL